MEKETTPRILHPPPQKKKRREEKQQKPDPPQTVFFFRRSAGPLRHEAGAEALRSHAGPGLPRAEAGGSPRWALEAGLVVDAVAGDFFLVGASAGPLAVVVKIKPGIGPQVLVQTIRLARVPLGVPIWGTYFNARSFETWNLKKCLDIGTHRCLSEVSTTHENKPPYWCVFVKVKPSQWPGFPLSFCFTTTSPGDTVDGRNPFRTTQETLKL